MDETIFQSEPPPRSELQEAIRKFALQPTSLVDQYTDAEPQTPPDADILADDVVLPDVLRCLDLGTSGIILQGPPGCGKSWYARKISDHLTDNDPERLFRIQFHPSFSYEDFVEGHVPDPASSAGFKVVDRIFLKACVKAREAGGKKVILLIDEINRGNPARIFGELLTYIEHDYRNETFTLPVSGRETSVPPNLLILGTMNPFDRSIYEIDQALLRRFDYIDIKPDGDALHRLLQREGSDWTEGQVKLIVDWFNTIQKLIPEEYGGLGHAHFSQCLTLERLKHIWLLRITPYLRQILFGLHGERTKDIEQSFLALCARLQPQGAVAGPPNNPVT
jgi:5-methylcytosine-specific restriction protein B